MVSYIAGVGFHEGKRILMPEKIGVSAIAMPESEYGQIKLVLTPSIKRRTSPQSNSAMHPGS